MGTFSLELTTDQSNALETFKLWLNSSPKGSPFVLSGFAGSGKTFLSTRFLKIADSKGLCWTVAAPTHKAVGVLRCSMELEGLRPVWYPSTIHRLLRLKLKRKGDLETCEQTEQTANSLQNLHLVLIDEASMIDSKLLEIALQCAYCFSTRLVFVGDPAQLPPVGESKSSVFSLKRAVTSELKQVVRHQGPVLNLASRLRDGRLPCQQPPCFPICKSDKGVVGCLDSQDWLARAKQALKEASIQEDPDAARILCYTNKSLEKLVPHARRAIHGEMADQLPVLPGEILITRMAVMAPASRDGVENGEEPDMLLGSNRELVVTDVVPERCDLAEFGITSQSDWTVPVIETLVAKVCAGEKAFSLRLLPPPGTSPRSLLDNCLDRLRQNAKQGGKQDSRTIWRKFFLVRDAFASLGPASVLTVHRSQGSSFGEVFVSSDVFWPKELSLRKQLIYVAVSRAREGVWFLGNKQLDSQNSIWYDQLNQLI